MTRSVYAVVTVPLHARRASWIAVGLALAACSSEQAPRAPAGCVDGWREPCADSSVADATAPLDAVASMDVRPPADRGPSDLGAEIDRGDSTTVADIGVDARVTCPASCGASSDCATCYTPGEHGHYCCMSSMCLYMTEACVDPPRDGGAPVDDAVSIRPDSAGDIDAEACSSSACARCTTACVGYPLAAFCTHACADNRDCSPGEVCARSHELFTGDDRHPQPVCVPAGEPRPCPGTARCDPAGPLISFCYGPGGMLRSTDVVLGPTCATVFEWCERGCVTDSDAGPPDSGVVAAAHCAP